MIFMVSQKMSHGCNFLTACELVGNIRPAFESEIQRIEDTSTRAWRRFAGKCKREAEALA